MSRHAEVVDALAEELAALHARRGDFTRGQPAIVATPSRSFEPRRWCRGGDKGEHVFEMIATTSEPSGLPSRCLKCGRRAKVKLNGDPVKGPCSLVLDFDGCPVP